MEPLSSLSLLVAELGTRGRVVVEGWAAIDALRRLLRRATSELGVELTFDPASEPALVQYVAASALQGLEDAAKGAALGLLIGALLGAPREGLLLGGVIGGGVGVLRGIDAVERGWRVSLSTNAEGSPVAILSAA